jgi:nicotinamidase-related amidase
MKNLLIVVDYQNDFVADDGKLTAGKIAQSIYSKIVCKIDYYINSDQDVLFTLDTHSSDSWNMHPESEKFPIHCEENTYGWSLYGELNKYISNPNVRTEMKFAYCPNLNTLNRVVMEYDQIEVVGVVTDICVFQTVIGLYTAKVNNFSKAVIKVDENCCASFNEDGHKYSIGYMRNILGIEIN